IRPGLSPGNTPWQCSRWARLRLPRKWVQGSDDPARQPLVLRAGNARGAWNRVGHPATGPSAPPRGPVADRQPGTRCRSRRDPTPGEYESGPDALQVGRDQQVNQGLSPAVRPSKDWRMEFGAIPDTVTACRPGFAPVARAIPEACRLSPALAAGRSSARLP